jgi:hypothetical protein
LSSRSLLCRRQSTPGYMSLGWMRTFFIHVSIPGESIMCKHKLDFASTLGFSVLQVTLSY